MVPERDHDKTETRDTTKLIESREALATHDDVVYHQVEDEYRENDDFVKNYWSKLDHKTNGRQDLNGLRDGRGESGSPGLRGESELKSSNLAKLGAAVGVPYPSMMDANIENNQILPQVAFGAKKGKQSPSVQTAQTALQRASHRHRGEDLSLELVMRQDHDQLSRQMAGEIEVGDSDHDRDRESNPNFASGANFAEDRKNFDTMTNPSIKCQNLEKQPEKTQASNEEDVQSSRPQKKHADLLLVGFEDKPKGKNPLVNRKPSATSHAPGGPSRPKGKDKNFNSNSEQKAKPNSKKSALNALTDQPQHDQQQPLNHLTFNSKATHSDSSNKVQADSQGVLSARGGRAGTTSEIMSPRIMYAQKYSHRGQT